MCRKYNIDIIFKIMRKYLSTLLVASVLAASCTKDAEVIREKIVSQSRPILSGQGQPENTKGEDGDYYLDLANADLYGPKTKVHGERLLLILEELQVRTEKMVPMVPMELHHVLEIMATGG